MDSFLTRCGPALLGRSLQLLGSELGATTSSSSSSSCIVSRLTRTCLDLNRGPPSGPTPSVAFAARGMTTAGLVGGDGLTRRFYKKVGVQPSNVEGSPGFQITLDGRVLKTPARRTLVLSSRALALAIAAEWEFQSERHVRPFTMPLMSLVATALDRTPETRDSIIKHLLRHLPTDSAVHRDEPGDLAKKQAAAYDPLIAFVNERLGLRLRTGDSIFGVKHPKGTAERVGQFLHALDDWELTCVDELARSCRSLVVALNVFYGRLGFEDAVWTARVEEEFQIDLWGMVEGGHDIDRADLRVRIASSCMLLRLLKAV